MFKKIVLAAVAVSTGALFFAACGGNDCETAADDIAAKYKSCGFTTTGSSSSTSTSGDSECSDSAGALLKAQAKCIDAASCDAITGKDPAATLDLAKCAQAAQTSGGTTGGTSGGTTAAATSSTGG